ncbi:MAG: helix-turn-helix transcriptional regulator [Bacteroidota bacterium]
MQFNGNTNEYLELSAISSDNCEILNQSRESSLSILWNLESGSRLLIDERPFDLEKNQLIFLTDFHKIKPQKITKMRLVRFNRPFYCILDHDSEVGCKGILFFGASNVPSIQIPEEELEKFEILWSMFNIEMTSKDKLQIEMLQMMLKRLIILCTRLNREQNNMVQLDNGQLNLVREFNFLVESHFKTKHTVAEYADLLHKSPKTLSNLFSKYQEKRPLQIIQERLMVEARRLLSYTEMTVKEVAYELGFDSIQAFSRFFKTKEGLSPKDFREKNA